MNMGEALRQEGRQEGMQKGRQEGIQTGRQEGMQKGRQEGIQTGRQEGIQTGRQEGMQTGRQEEKYAVAISMLKEGSDTKFVQRVTGLSSEQIDQLAKEHTKPSAH